MTASFLINFHYNEITVKDYSLKKKNHLLCSTKERKSWVIFGNE